ncbi:DUF2163 domain-containing protein [Allosphingosinicella sp.]|jgi:uncharacterized phage protein (TIGR02218 family)|uniref:DUF2163 domain-containing protein n=1 Tax=Allosphingosinicella sp. TaxID=2823234 RepID=UPI002F012B85
MSIIGKELATIAFCWLLERPDGVALGFTSHDRDLAIEGLLYRAAPGMLPSSISTSDGFDVDSLDVEGSLTSDAITAEDLAAGRWDGAALTIFMADWQDPGGSTIAVARGELGGVSIRGKAFEAELRGPTSLLEVPVVEQTSPECRASLGDKRCRVDMAGRVRVTRIAAIVGEAVIDVESAAPGNAYGYGHLRWLTGANSGLESPMLRSDGTRLTLREPPHLAAAAGDLVEISEGCDRSLATCSARFGNAANFRGEPHLPGLDLLTRYPGG